MDVTTLLTKLDAADFNLIRQQEYIECLSRGLGTQQFRKVIDQARDKSRESTTTYGLALMSHAIDNVADAICAFIDKAKSGGPGRRHASVKYLAQVDPEIAAFIVLKSVLDGVTQTQILQKTAMQIGNMIEDEIRFAIFEEMERKKYRSARERVKKATVYRHKRISMTAMMRAADIDFEPWSRRDKLHIGVNLIDIVMQATGYVSIENKVKNRFQRHEHTKILVPTKAVNEWIKSKNSRCELLAPHYLPCVLPPRDWTTPHDGGYHTPYIRPLSLVKTSNRAYLEELTDNAADMPTIYHAVNALQRTPWQVNSRVLDVMREVWDNDISMTGLVSRSDIDEVVCPECGTLVPIGKTNARHKTTNRHACFDHSETTHKQWKIRAAKVHQENIAMRSKRVQIAKVIWMAEIFQDFEEIYMPYQLDFRGRIYAVPHHLNPQGADYARGLLQFAEGKYLDSELAASWLAVHGANVYGYDKASLVERIEFIGSMNEQIKAVAADPIEHIKIWSEADKLWQFLGFCFEWAGFLENGYDHISHLPIALDGSCSGIQHFSAMLRDEVGAEAVNLIPAEKPRDIYQQVCHIVLEKLEEHATEPEEYPYANGWLDLEPDRKMTKRQVMTLPYGSTKHSCREYTMDYLIERFQSLRSANSHYVTPWPEDEMFEAVSYAADLIWDSIGEVVIGARQAMAWLQKYAKIVAKQGFPITWTTPAGFPVWQAYPEMKALRVETKLGDGMVKLTLREEKDTINRSKMAQGIAPNFVHSMDAAHLMLSVKYAWAEGLEHFAMIHDSFATHACDTETLSACLRNAFVDMYSCHDVLSEFREDMIRMLPDSEIKKLPGDLTKSDLDLNVVKESLFFFA